MIVLGLDLSLTRAGIAVLRDGIPAFIASVGHERDGTSHAHRSRRIVSQSVAVLDPIIGKGRRAGLWPDLAVIEDQLEHGPMLPSALDRSALWWGVYSALAAKSIPVAVVNPGTLKKFATGKGNSGKPDVLAAAREWCRPANHDESDAAWLAGMGAMQSGDLPPFAMTPWRIAGLTAVHWPVSA